MRQSITFMRSGELVTLTDVNPTESVLDYLRLTEKKCGTKEGCNEGDCGACTVVLGTPNDDGKIDYQCVNSCIQFVGTLDGKLLLTVEDLKRGDGSLHPVQRTMVDLHASQCGFCTPGFVMSLYALYLSDDTPSHDKVLDQISGNLCRCTGYRPIIDAALKACTNKTEDTSDTKGKAAALALLMAPFGKDDILVGNENKFFASPASLPALLDLYARHPDATLIAGTTDVGLWVTKGMKKLPKIIYLGRVRELLHIDDTTDFLSIGAGVTYEMAEHALADIDPDIGALLRRLGSVQVRAVGTIGGNIANGSPIGDTPPLLIALGSTIELASIRGTRVIPLEEFFIRYGKQDIAKDEVLTRITIPKLAENQRFRSYKISKRFDQDISAVLGAFCLTVENGTITQATIAYGGMAEIPKRAISAEKLLVGTQIADQTLWEKAGTALDKDFSPISDMRSSAAYRQKIARNLLQKALIEMSGTSTLETRVYSEREKRHVA